MKQVTGLTSAAAVLVIAALVAVVVLILAAPSGVDAQQQAGTLSRIGVLASSELTPALQEAFRQGLRDHGHIEGRNILLEWRAAGGRPDQAATLAAELVDLKVAVIVAVLTPAVQAARKATSTTPIVMAPAGEPVRAGFVASLARPGGNITGITTIGAELAGKRLELLREIVPRLGRIAVLIHPGDPFAKAFVDEYQTASKRLGIQVQIVAVQRPEEIEGAFSTMVREGAAAVAVQLLLTQPSWRTAGLAIQHRLASLSGSRHFVASGGLLSYAASLNDIYRRAATYVDKILKGAKPGDLPVEQPTKFELVVNLKTARSLGLTIPQTVLLRADETID